MDYYSHGQRGIEMMSGPVQWSITGGQRVAPPSFPPLPVHVTDGPSPGRVWPSGLLSESAPAVGPSAIAVGVVLLGAVPLLAWRWGIPLRSIVLRRHRRLSNSAWASLLFAGIGVASLGGWFLRGGAPSSPLLYFGGIGLFGAVLVSLLLPGRTVSPMVAEALYGALVSTVGEAPDARETSGNTVYYPGGDAADPLDVRVYTLDTATPAYEGVERDSTAVGANSSFRFQPSGAVLYQAFRSRATTTVATDPETFAWQLCQGLTDWFELVSSATPAVEATDGMTIHVEGSAIPGVGKFDHPVVSFLGVALACERERPMVISVQPQTSGPGAYRIGVHPFATVSAEQSINLATQKENHDGPINC